MPDTDLPKTVTAQGKRLLMDAALRLAAISRSLSGLGLRELAREAGLNPNTFYRHFKTVDDLGLAMIAEMAARIRQPLRALRFEAAERAERDTPAKLTFGVDLARGQRVCSETVELFFAYAAQNPHAFIVGVRELHGSSKVLREALEQMMEAFASDMAEDLGKLQLLPSLEPAAVRQVSSMISRQLFQQSLDYIEQVDRRPAICAQAQAQILMMFAGATVLQAVGELKLGAD
ncbi:TetR family transcriptional regulator [Pseudomonas turukhanskensis]|uniref:TetR family transcriptional regulator n=1 Tax=Pseudomonas turukhanskensis TaxID=1806536 RepID=A0A9W6KAE8_9PSED|nr:TetR family transcriptional regulator [Pseudomonas turukhanskensis]GLK90635.1 TetR family transcriptional regulator [Pseudomonas turukhanskensis]